MKTKFNLLIILMFFVVNTDAQKIIESNNKQIDEAIKELEKLPKSDTTRLRQLIKVINIPIFKAGKERVMNYYFEAKALSKKLNSKQNMAHCYFFMGVYQKSKMNYGGAIKYLDSMSVLTQNSADTTLQMLNAFSYYQKGHIYNASENYYSALANFFEALKFYNTKNSQRSRYSYKTIGNIYYNLHNYAKSNQYNKAFLTQCLLAKDTPSALDASILLAQTYIELNKIDSAKYYLSLLKTAVNDSLDNTLVFAYYQKVGLIHYLENNFSEAETNFKKALTFTTDPMHSATKAYILGFYARNELKRGNTSKAKMIADEYLLIAETNNIKNHLVDAYATVSDCYQKIGNTPKALEYLQKSVVIKDSLLTETNLRQANTLASIYEVEKKEKEILKLQSQSEIQEVNLKKESFLNKILFGGALALIIIGLLGYRNFINRQKIQQLKITELEKNKQLQSVDAMLKGQEDERNRIAKDLHDGLGGMLSGVKISFTTMKENLVMSAENVSVFEQSISQLDSTISELRKIAHNLMPEALVRFGLHDAIKDFCTSIMSATHINIVYENLGEIRKLDNTANTYIYRIIQELINNAVKHSNPKQILVQITTTPNKTLLTVEDDGYGMDASKMAISKGIGITNIQHRVNYFKGNVTFENKNPQGTSVNIELNV